MTAQQMELIQQILFDKSFHNDMAMAVKDLTDNAISELTVDKNVIVKVCAKEVFAKSIDSRYGENTSKNPLIEPLWTVVLDAYNNLPKTSNEMPSAFDKFRTADISYAEKR